jgi:hypothetical protein
VTSPSCLDGEHFLLFVAISVPARLAVEVGLELLNIKRLDVPLVLKPCLRSSEGHVLGHLQM